MPQAQAASPVSSVTFDHRLAPHVRVRHAIRGRTRLSLDPLKGRADLLSALARRVAAREGVISVHENPWSGSLLVEHDKALAPEAIAETVRELWRSGLSGTVAAAPADAVVENWHALPPQAAISAFASVNGLSSAEAHARIARIGENRLSEPPPTPLHTLLADQLKSVPVGLLGGSAVLSVATGALMDAALTIGVIALNAGIGVSTESWTASLIRRLARPTDPDATVLRDGREHRTATSRIAPGDWIILKPGAAVPADARLISTDGLTIDESSLTGESHAVEKAAESAVDVTAPLGARRTMVYRGSIVTSGQGVAIVTATGEATEIGRVRTLLHSAKAPLPPMERALDQLGVRITIACLGASAILGVMLLARGERLSAITRSAVALAVSAIPEGLPALAASTKALAARTMAGEGAFVRNINVVETAANIDVLCLDKTGTLTQNRMEAAEIQTLDGGYRADDGDLDHPNVKRIAEIAALCNDATLSSLTDPSAGSGTELALLHFARDASVDVQSLRAANARTGILPRTATRLYMATEHADAGVPKIALKGAPHQVLALCTTAHVEGEASPLDDDARTTIRAQNERLARQGLRVLGFARGAGRSLDDGEPEGLEWLGLVGLRDPLRPGAGKAIEIFQRAGLRTIILTGDQAGTAEKLAADLGFATDGALDVIDASTLRDMTPDEIAAVARKAEVFARVSPADKLAIIKALQADGHVVAMTGDGVNDGPALRAADVGIAMGKSGADVARDVADIVIADDDLGGLVSALMRGRAADDNLQRAVRFLLATNASEVALLLAEALHGPDALETPAELFWLNLMTDVFPALGLAMARPAADILDRPPRAATADIFGRKELTSIGADALRIAMPAIITHVFSTARHGVGPKTRGLTFLALASHQLVHALRIRPGRPATDLLDRPIELGVAAGYALLAAPFALPILRRVLRIAAPPPLQALVIVGFSFAPLALRILADRRAKA